MFKLLRGGNCFSPDNIGKKDVLTVYNKIYKVEESIKPDLFPDIEVIDCSGCIVCPSFIDQHVHIIGGGGEEGPGSRVPELMFGDVISAGISTVVGVLGVDDVTRNMESLLAKARGFEEEGLNTFIYTGSYAVPTRTITGSVKSDIILIDKIIGAGEIAIADHRSSYPTINQLAELAYQINVGGLIGKKAGVMHIHVGDGKDGIGLLYQLVNNYDFPIGMFVPTHLNRTAMLLEEAEEYLCIGGNADLTAGENSSKGISVPEALSIFSKKNLDMQKVTVSSDGNGSIPAEGGKHTGVGLVKQLYEDIKESIINEGVEISKAIAAVTANVARILGMYPQKGTIAAGSDADILVLESGSLKIKELIVKGERFISNGIVLKKGRYEK